MKFLTAFFALTITAFASDTVQEANDIFLTQRNALNNGQKPQWQLDVPPSSLNGLFIIDGPNAKPHIAKIGFALTWDTVNDAVSFNGAATTGDDFPWLEAWMATESTTVAGKLNSADFNTMGDARYVQLAGSYSNPSWITALAYSKLTGAPTNVSSFTNDSGYTTAAAVSATYATQAALTAGLAAKFNTPTGSTSQYLRGDGSLAAFPTNVSAFTNDSGYLTSASAASTYATQASVTSSLAGKFNNPSGTTAQYLRGDGSLATFPTNNTAFTNGAGYLTAEVDGSVTNEIELPTQSGQSGKFLTTNGTSPAWAAISVSKSFANPARSLNTAFQVSTTTDAFVSYTVDVSATLTLTGGQTGTVTLQYADNSAMTTNPVTVQSSVNGNTGALTVGLSLTQTSTAALTGIIPAGKWVRITTANTAGTPTFTYRAAQEVAF